MHKTDNYWMIIVMWKNEQLIKSFTPLIMSTIFFFIFYIDFITTKECYEFDKKRFFNVQPIDSIH